MKDTDESRSDLANPSQFSLAAMFYVTTLMTLVFSATAPFFRAINAENRNSILIYGSVQVACVLLFLFGYVARRIRVLRMTNNGELIHRTTFMDQGTLGFWRSVIALRATIPAMLLLMLAGVSITASPWTVALFLHPVSLAFQVLAIREAIRASLSLYYGVDKRDLEVFQSGYAHGGYSFQPWGVVTSVRPAEHDDIALMVVYEEKIDGQHYSSTMYTRKLVVRPHIRAEVYEAMSNFLE